MKKRLKYIALTVVLIFGLLLAVPFLFKDKIKEVVKESINKNLHAKVDFEDVNLSLIRNFPNASVGIEKISVINHEPFAGDTLFYTEELNLKMSIIELFKDSSEQLIIDEFSMKNGVANIIFNKEGVANYDVAIKKEEEQEASDPIMFELSEYSLKSVRFTYEDRKNPMKFILSEINHQGEGNFTQEVLDLDTKTQAFLSFEKDGTTYFDGLEVALDAVLGMDNKNSTYTFKENELLLNKLPLSFDGFMQLKESGQFYDLKFNAPSSDFYHFLGLIPSSFKGDLDDVACTGKLALGGFIKGDNNDQRIPSFDVKIKADNAAFQFPDLPKKVENIQIDSRISNKTGQINDTELNINPLTFRIDQDKFFVKSILKNLMVNPNVDAALKGTLNLSNLTKAYPVDLSYPLSGILKADVVARFDQQSVENQSYQNIESAGNILLSGFNYMDSDGKELLIKETKVNFTPSEIEIERLRMKTGKTDLNMAGVVSNFYGYLMSNQTLSGKFNATSNSFQVSDFMSSSEPSSKNKEQSTPSQPLKIPKNLDLSITAKANEVFYDDMILKNVTGQLGVKNQGISLENVSTDIFGGQIGLNGWVSTLTEKPKFNMQLALNELNIGEACRKLGFLTKVLPIADIVKGKLVSKVELSGFLNDEMSPEINTLSGDLFGQLLQSAWHSKNSVLLQEVGKQLKFFDPNKLDLNQIQTRFTFQNGKVAVKPFSMKYQDIDMIISGEHGFDQSLNYNIQLEVPTKYLGTDINNAIASFSAKNAQTISSIPVNLTLGGSFNKPLVKTDLKNASKDLAIRLAKDKKEELLNKGISEVDDVLKDLKIKNPNDSSKLSIPTTKEEVNQTLQEEKKKLEEEAKKKAQEELKKQKNKLLDKVWGK